MICEIFLVSDSEHLTALQECTIQAARILKANGLKLREPVSVCSTPETLAPAIATGLARSNILLIIGGMGSEGGYMSKRVVAEGLRIPLADNTRCLSAIQAYCARTDEVYTPEDATLASLPKDARAFLPQFGKLPGCAVSSSRQHIIMLPENVSEILPMLQSDVLPYLTDAGVSGTDTHYVRAVGISLERVESLLADLTATANPVVTVEADQNEILVRVGAQGADQIAAAALCTPVLTTIAERLGDYAYGLDVNSLEAAVVKKMNKKSLALAIAEHGTDGMLTRMLKETENGQDTVRYTTEANEPDDIAKNLGVPAKKLKKHGLISEYAAVAVANAVRVKAAAHIGISVFTAPPEYGNEKNTGVVYIAVCDRDSVYVKKLVVSVFDEADGDAVIDASVARALNMLRLFVDYYPEHYHASTPLFKALDGHKNVTDHDRYEDNAFGDILVRPRQGAMSAILDNLIFRKGDKISSILKKFVFTFSLVVFLVCAGYLGCYHYDSFAALKDSEQLRNIYYSSSSAATIPAEYPANYNSRFAQLWLINPDIAGFLTIENTNIDYPVVQTANNRHYLSRAFNGSYSNYAIPFIDYRANIEHPSDNLVIYGRNMRNGRVFATIAAYRDLAFYKAHPLINFSTLHSENTYIIFSVLIADAGQNDSFNYHDMINAASDEDFAEYLDQLKMRSIFDTGIQVEPGDKLLTLSTSSDEDFTGAHFVVVARALREDEEFIDVNHATFNSSPLYPDIWYEKHGGERPNIPVVSVSIDSENTVTESSSAPSSSIIFSSESEKVSHGAESSEPEQSNSEQSNSADEASSAVEASRSAAEAASLAEVSRIAAESSSMAEASRAEASRIAAEAAEASRLEASRIAAESAAAVASQAAAIKQLEDNAEAIMRKAEEEFFAANNALEKAENSNSRAVVQELADAEFKRLDRLDALWAQIKAEADKAGTARAKVFVDDVGHFYEETLDIYDYMIDRVEELSAVKTPSGNTGSPELDKFTVTVNGQRMSGDTLNVVARIVQTEVGSSFHKEAIKAQAVAAYTYVAHSNLSGAAPTVYLSSRVDSKVLSAVQEVIGEAVYYNGALAHTTYYATSAGRTNSAKDVWGGSYPYLISVDSSIDEQHSTFSVEKIMTRQQVADAIKSKLGITPTGNPEEWFDVISLTEGGYNDRMSVCGETRSKNGTVITGRLLRESVLSLRSACFDIEYDSSRERFVFTSYGYGHGVGMSQNGAHFYASQEGWDYIDILTHYYPGTEVR